MTLLERLKELAQQATPGPWEVNPGGAEEWWYSDTIVNPGGSLASCTEGNAALIVTAINALPALIAVAEAAKKVDASITATYNASRYSVSRSKADVLAAALAALEVEA